MDGDKVDRTQSMDGHKVMMDKTRLWMMTRL